MDSEQVGPSPYLALHLFPQGLILVPFWSLSRTRTMATAAFVPLATMACTVNTAL